MSAPVLSLSFTHIKTPQLIGIIAGCLVFTATISAVVLLLYQSGTLSRFRDEMMSGTPLSLKTDKKEEIAPQSSMLPELYEHLLIAASTLPLQPIIPELKGERLLLRMMEVTDIPLLLSASNGSALYGESAYNPARIWGWINYKNKINKENPKENSNGNPMENPKENVSGNEKIGRSWPSDSITDFKECYPKNSNSEHLVIVDRVTQKQIGMLSLVDNRPEDLNIRIDNFWLTPAFQTRKYSHEAFLQILGYLFSSNYRRVVVEVDMKNIIMRKFLERCGFQHESTMRKHRIIERRNRDTGVYVILNSDYEQIEVKLKKILGIDIRAKMHKVAEIEESSSNSIPAKNVPQEIKKKKESNKKK